MDWKRRKYCGDISPTDAGKQVILMGWVDAIRDHGHVIFIHLRDIRGIVQVVFDPRIEQDFYQTATTLHEEYVIEVQGKVTFRAKGTENPNLATGQLEVAAARVHVLSQSKHLPFQISEKAMILGEELKANPENVDEDLRLQYRYLDLRRPSVQTHFIKRYQITRSIREHLDQNNFIELETPVLTKSTPEGARDYLVPSRVHPGRFYALPQSPQLFKQLLMIGGMDRYFQIVKCFRDEDLRPNRQPEFTQLDLEASFVDEEFIYEIIEQLIVKIFALGDIQLTAPFSRMIYQEAMNKYGTDRPDLRFGMAFQEITDLLKKTKYTIFRRIIQNNGHVKGFCVKGLSGTLSKNVLQNEYSMKIAPSYGAKGMSWMKVVNGKLESNIVRFFRPEEQTGLLQRFQAEDGDVIILIADNSLDLVNKILGKLRLHIANRLNIISDNHFCPVWITNFPLFETDGEKLSPSHHPFTMPDSTDFDPNDREALHKLNSRAYDLVMNGEELGGGSVRIHRMDIQQKIFQALGMGPEEAEAKFGFFLRALEYGTPPHAGLALGLDRVVAMILKLHSIRDVITFPKNRSAHCPLTQAPSPVDREQLEELKLNTESKPVKKAQQPAQKPALTPAPPATEQISKSEVKHVAKLARLKLSDSEIESYQKDLNAILTYAGMLAELDTENVPPMHHIFKKKNVWREDKPGSSETAQSIVENAPQRNEEYFQVPKILEG